MPLQEGRWIVGWGTSDCLNFGLETPGLQYDMGTDTTIGTQTYQALVRSGVCEMCCPPVALPKNGYLGALRDDGNGRVWYVAADSSSEMLFLDFTLEVGDTVTGYPLAISGTNWEYPIVVAVDSVILGDGEYHRRMRLDGPHDPPPDLIAGVGPTTGLLEAFSNNLEVTAELRCAIIGAQVLYSAGLADCDQHVGMVHAASAGTDALAVPNANGGWTIRPADMGKATILRVSLIDTLGREIWGTSSAIPLAIVELPARTTLPPICFAVVLLADDRHITSKSLSLPNP